MSEGLPARLAAAARTILRLVVFGLVYNLAEGILCVGAGIQRGA